jgi:hypothetical protein
LRGPVSATTITRGSGRRRRIEASQIILEIFGGIAFDAAIQLETRRSSQQGAQLICGDSPLPISVEGHSFQGDPCGIARLPRERRGQFVGKVYNPCIV